MKSVELVGVDGSVWPLTSVEHNGVFLKAEPTSLSAESDGEPVSGQLDLVVADHLPFGEELRPIRETSRLWRNAWSVRKWSKLVVKDDEGLGPYFLDVRLSTHIDDFGEVDPDGFVEFSQAVRGKTSSWSRTVRHEGDVVRVANTGDVDSWPRVRWDKAGVLAMPSGATINLPAVESPRTIWLDPRESCVVKDDAGNIDREIWLALRGSVFPEVLPADDEYREFGLPDGAVLFYEIGESPW